MLHRRRTAILVSTAPGMPRDRRAIIVGAALFPLQDCEGEFEQNTFYRSLEQVGIGALPFLPSRLEYVKDWLRQILTESGSEYRRSGAGSSGSDGAGRLGEPGDPAGPCSSNSTRSWAARMDEGEAHVLRTHRSPRKAEVRRTLDLRSIRESIIAGRRGQSPMKRKWWRST